MEKLDIPIGETIETAGVTLTVVEDRKHYENNCELCYFHEYLDCGPYLCSYEDREDEEDVHFEEV